MFVYRARVYDHADFQKVLFEQYSLNKAALEMQLRERMAYFTAQADGYGLEAELDSYVLDHAHKDTVII